MGLSNNAATLSDDPASPSDNSVISVVVDGVSLSVKRLGRGAPVVCLSAIGHDAEDFAALGTLIGDGFELLRIEWPGHGDSCADRHPVSAARYAELLEGAMQALGIEKPIILGNSIGGAVGILYASRRPLRGLILCDSGGLIEVTPKVQQFCSWFEAFFAAGERGARGGSSLLSPVTIVWCCAGPVLAGSDVVSSTRREGLRPSCAKHGGASADRRRIFELSPRDSRFRFG